jgi:hypothetical protein
MITTTEYQHIVASQMSEKQWRQTVVDFAHMRGWMSYHTWNSIHSEAGFPDEVFIRVPRLVIVEFKREGGRLSQHQKRWLSAFSACGVETHTLYPSQMDEVIRIFW